VAKVGQQPTGITKTGLPIWSPIADGLYGRARDSATHREPSPNTTYWFQGGFTILQWVFLKYTIGL